MHRPNFDELGPKYTQSRDAIKDVWGERTPYKGFGAWKSRVDYNMVDDVDEWYPSACVSCSIGCGCDIGVKYKKDAEGISKPIVVGVRGRENDRVNKGRLGPKGMYAWHSLRSKDRLTHPLIRNKEGVLEKATWEEAMSLIVEKTKDIQKRLTSHGIAFYTSGQLFLEEYLTLAVVGKGGLGTLHMDGNTRLCTATAAAAMRESFGSDGQPSSYSDIDECDALFLVGHNPAATGTVLWARMLDRMEHTDPPKLVVIDPRVTAVAERADVHLQPRVGTNLAVLNGLQRLIIKSGLYDQAYIDRSVCDFENLKSVVDVYTPEYVERVSGVSVDQLEQAAEILGKSERLLSTALQGVYQSNQATASACAINNIALMRGMIGKPGAGVFQMNGQPTAQNNRETGCDGEYPCFRNYQNEDHMNSLAEAWNIDLAQLPHHAQPTHVNDLLNYMEDGSIEMLWISGTNPAVSLPELERIRRILTMPSMFVIAQDIFPNETTELADVVLPAAGWSEKNGCYTNVDRTVHFSAKAVDPPGEAKSDFAIWVDFAQRMEFKDKDGKPLVWWKTAEEAFELWRRMSENTICDYSGLTWGKLKGSAGIQWPCNELTSPNGTERLYIDGVFPTTLEKAQTWTSDLETGTPLSKEQFKELAPNGRAIFKASHFHASDEMPNARFPFSLTTGRRVYHFHTRTRTSRSKPLHDAAPGPYVQISREDATQLGVEEGDDLIVRSRCGEVQIEAKIGEIDVGQVFIPFHFGQYDADDVSSGRNQAANELTRSAWDTISKQPLLKSGAVSLEKAAVG